jgi:hypothetical protein
VRTTTQQDRSFVHTFSTNRFRARNGIELVRDSDVARRGLRSATLKPPQKSETITSSLWTSALAKSLLRPKNRSPFSVRCSLERKNVAASANSLRADNRAVVESVGSHALNKPQGEACDSTSNEPVSDAGSTPAASTCNEVMTTTSVEQPPRSASASSNPKSVVALSPTGVEKEKSL